MHMVHLLHSEYHEYEFQLSIQLLCVWIILRCSGAPPAIVLGDRQVPVLTSHTSFCSLSQIENVSLAVEENQLGEFQDANIFSRLKFLYT